MRFFFLIRQVEVLELNGWRMEEVFVLWEYDMKVTCHNDPILDGK